MEHFPEIETERLQLSELKASDIPDIVKYASNEKVAEFTKNMPSPYFEADAIYWLNLAHTGFKDGSNYIFGIRLKPDLNFIGGVGLTVDQKSNRAEIGYWIAEPFWGKGFTTEATKAIIKFGFDTLKLNKLTSSYLAKNPASGKVMDKSGMVKEGELKSHVLKNGEYHDLILYGILNS